MFILQCKKRGIKSINIVRRADHAERLLGLGADYVLVTSNENF